MVLDIDGGYDGPEISERAREAAREFFAVQTEGHAKDVLEEVEPTRSGSPSFGIVSGPADADGGRSPVSDGVLISNAELHRLLGAAWLSGYTQAGVGQGASPGTSQATASVVRQSAGVPTHSGVSVSSLPDNPGWIPVMHANGQYPCSGQALYVTSRPRRDQVAKLDLLRIWASPPLPPGSAPQPPYWRVPLPSDEPTCATCTRPINVYTNADLDWNVVLI